MERERILSKYKLPEKTSSDGYYHLWVKTEQGRKQIKAKNIDNLIEKVIDFEHGIKTSDKKTFKEVFEIMIEQKMKYVKNSDRKLSVNNTVLHLQQSYNRFFRDTFIETLPVNSITKQDIEKICYENLEKYELRKKAFLELRGIIKQTLQYSFEQYWVMENVYNRVDFKKFNDMLVTVTPITKRVHSDEEVNLILDYLHNYQNIKPNYIPAYALELQILAGLRRGEVPPIEWSDVTESYIIINKEQIIVRPTEYNSKSFNKVVQHTKTYTDRTFPITSEIRTLLNKLRNITGDSKYLFPNPKSTEGIITNNTIYPFYSRICKELGIEISREFIKGPHSFRRNGITRVANKPGGNIIMASMLYGNSPSCATSHYYSGINMDLAKEILEG